MNFRPDRSDDVLEINLVPLIDVLLVILIFLAATTTFSRFTQLEITLPHAQALPGSASMINITISRDGIYAMDGRLVSGNTTQDIAQAITAIAQQHPAPSILIHADAQATHESVIRIMEAASLAKIERINFATQSTR